MLALGSGTSAFLNMFERNARRRGLPVGSDGEHIRVSAVSLTNKFEHFLACVVIQVQTGQLDLRSRGHGIMGENALNSPDRNLSQNVVILEQLMFLCMCTVHEYLPLH